MNEEEKPRDEMIRQLTDLAIRSGRNRQSKQTGFVHFCYHPDDDERHDTIPLAENFLFSLALLQSRTTESIIEARGILERLLNFQGADGNFPVYLHEYPLCRDRFLGAQILPALFWILKIFHSVLGSDFQPKLRIAAHKLLQYSLQTYREKPAPNHMGIKIAASAKGLGELWNIPEIANEGMALLSLLEASPDRSAWYSPASMADILIGLQIAYPNLSKSPWKTFWNHLQATWHPSTGTYSGPPLREFQQGFEPQPTLYDLYLGYISGAFSQRALADHPGQMHAALIAPTGERMTSESQRLSENGSIDSCKWYMHQHNGYAYSLLEQREPGRLCPDRGRHILRLVWGTHKWAHTFICQGGNSAYSTFQAHEGEIDLSFDLNEVIPSEDREKNREVIFFFDIPDEADIFVQGVPASTFQLGDTLQIKADGLQFTMCFTLQDGDGQFFGHVMPGNRLSQLSLRGADRFNAYDWQIFLRTVRRNAPCRINVKLKIDVV